VVDVVERHPLGGAADGERLERLADVDDLLPVLRAEAAHDQLAARSHLEQPLAAQKLERLPHGRLRDPQLLRQRGLPDDGADRQPPAQDVAADVLVCALAQGLHRRG
jgi:hypothetical protein